MCLKRVILLAIAVAVGHGVGPLGLAQGEIAIGMPRQKVLETLGEPIGKLREGSQELLVYKTMEVRVLSNRVVHVNHLNETLLPTSPAPIPKSAPPPPPAGVASPAAVADAVPTETPPEPVVRVPAPAFAQLFAGQAEKYRGIQFTTGRKVFLIVGLIFGLAGFAVALGASIWFLIRAFLVHVGWGLACLFLPLAQLVFLCCHWREGRKPFFVSLAGLAGAMVGIAVALGLGVMPAVAGAKSPSAAGIPAGSLANEILIRDALPTALLFAGGLGCAAPQGIQRVEVLRQPEGPSNGMRWEERWFISGCGKELPVDLVFQEDGRGGASFEVRAPK
ncbi:MAG: hypothetical protein PCFJNLEI_03985 [Verrucomicrobiae bacterium]|nr:hypothetical protein [Verrucomicrobiae bacterium]